MARKTTEVVIRETLVFNVGERDHVEGPYFEAASDWTCVQSGPLSLGAGYFDPKKRRMVFEKIVHTVTEGE